MQAHRSIRAFLVLTLVLCASTAFAQFGEPLGTLEATFQGEERTWTTYEYPETEEEGVPASANYVPFPGGLMEGSIDGYPEGAVREDIQGTLSIGFMLEGMPEGCPCRFEDWTILYFADQDYFGDVYVSSEGEGFSTFVFDRFERQEDGTLVLEGTVEAALDFYPGENSEAEPGEKEPIRLEGDLSTKVVPDRDVSIE